MEKKSYFSRETSLEKRFARRLATANHSKKKAPKDDLLLMIAPEVGAESPRSVVYLESNGYPVYICVIIPGSGAIFSHCTTEGIEWWLLSLQQFEFSGTTEDEAIGFIEEKMKDAGMVV